MSFPALAPTLPGANAGAISLLLIQSTPLRIGPITLTLKEASFHYGLRANRSQITLVVEQEGRRQILALSREHPSAEPVFVAAFQLEIALQVTRPIRAPKQAEISVRARR